MKRNIKILGACLGWFAIVSQFVLMLQNRQADVAETIIRFFSFFTILTNIVVALYFTAAALKLKKSFAKLLLSNGAITAPAPSSIHLKVINSSFCGIIFKGLF